MGFIFLLENPGQYEAVRQFLGHTNISTTIAFYAGIEMQDAAKALDGTVKKRRCRTRGQGQALNPVEERVTWRWSGEALSIEQVPAMRDTAGRPVPGPLVSSPIRARRKLAGCDDQLQLARLSFYLGWLAHHSSFVASTAIGSPMTSELIIEFIEEMRRRGNAAATILMRVLALERVLAVLSPESDRADIRLIIRNLPEGRDASAKRARLQETAVLVDLGIALMMVGKPGTLPLPSMAPPRSLMTTSAPRLAHAAARAAGRGRRLRP